MSTPASSSTEISSTTRVDIIERVQERLENSRMFVSSGVDTVMSPILYGKNPQGLDTFLRFVENSHLVSDETMCQFLGAVVDPNGHVERATQFYVRSVKFTCAEARQIMRVYCDPYYDRPYASSFLDSLAEIPEESPVYMRYAGCTHASTPTQRTIDDWNYRSPRRLTNVCKVIKDMFPRRLFNVFNLQALQVSDHEFDYQRKVDEIEQVLIHILGRNRLLNSQPGDSLHYNFTVAPQDRLHIDLPEAKSNLVQNSSSGHQEVADKRTKYLSVFDEYKPELLNIMEEAIVAQLTDEHIPQATKVLIPSNDIFVEGFTPISIFSDHITFEAFSMLRSVFDGSATGHHITNLINQALGTELSPARLSFADLWPMACQYIEFDMHGKFMGRYYKVIKPLIVPAISFDAAAVAVSNFHGCLSLGPDEYKQIIGDLRIINYESDFDYSSPNDAAPNATCWAVCIVRYHPAFLRSTAVDPALVHLFYLVWLRTLVAVECALQLLKADKSAQTPGTLEFAERLDEYTLQKEASIELDARLKDARQQVIELLKWNATGRLENSCIRGIVPGGRLTSESAKETSLIARSRYGVIQGPPNSPAREQQCNELVRSNCYAFQCCPSYRNDQSKWRRWFCNLDEDKEILQAVRHQA